MLNFKDVKITIGNKVLHVGNLDVSGPGSLAIIGVNGVGKTTLLRVMLGLLEPTEGTVLLSGRDIKSYSRVAIASKLAYVPQVVSLQLYMSAVDFILTASLGIVGIMGSPGPNERARANSMLKELNVEHLAERNIATLSGGEMRIVALARALYQAPTCILDEVYAPLDISAVLRVKRNIQDSVDRGNLMIYTTHDIQTAQSADKVLLVYQDGTVELRPKNGISNMMLKRVYGVNFSTADTKVGVVERNWVTHKI